MAYHASWNGGGAQAQTHARGRARLISFFCGAILFACTSLTIRGAGTTAVSESDPTAPASTSASADAAASEVAPWEIYLVFEKHCVDCHGGHLARPKGKMGYILDLRRLVTEGKVKPGHPDDSDLFLALTADDPEDKMPPSDSDAPPLSPEEIAKVRQWILAGAQVDPKPPAPPPTTTKESAADAPADAAKKDAEKKSPSLGQILGRLHPVVVHLPIGLLLGALLAEVGSRIAPRLTWLRGAVRAALWAGFIGALIAVGCGWLNARYEGYGAGTVETHRWLGVATAAAALVALIANELLWRRRAAGVVSPRALAWTTFVVLIVVGALVAITGHTGGLITYGADYFWGF